MQRQTFTDNVKFVIFQPEMSIKRGVNTLVSLIFLMNFPCHAAFIGTLLRRTFVIHKTIDVVGLVTMMIHILHRLHIIKSSNVSIFSYSYSWIILVI